MFMSAFWVLVLVLGVFFLVRWLSGSGKSRKTQEFLQGDDVLDILKQRYARGDIEREEFQQKRHDLGAQA
jgi:putative membrane protein